VKPYLFSIVGWESRAIPEELGQWIFSDEYSTDDATGVVIEYFSSTERIRTLRSEIAVAIAGNGEHDLVSLEAELDGLQARKEALESTVEKILERQVRDMLTEQGIHNPVATSRINFPPVNFRLEKLPYLLVISPRERVESMREITLQPELSLEEIEAIEAKVDELGVSSLVLRIGGLGATFPSLVTNEASLHYTIEAIVEEWLHQYLAFKPLGFRYLLDVIGLSRDYEIATINETLAGMVSKEIGLLIYMKHYSEYESSTIQKKATETEFDFNREMREIRKAVDVYLARGEIEQAEEFMEQKRQHLASMGYHIRKLNQAYFAFHGTYADEPTSVSPIGVELKELRDQSTSLKDFLTRVAGMTSRQELKDSLR